MEQLEFMFETNKFKYFRDFFEGNEVIFVQDKSNPVKIFISTESIAQVLGFKSADDMMGSDKFLDFLNDYMRKNQVHPPLKDLIITIGD